jgi:hypothetical protein
VVFPHFGDPVIRDANDQSLGDIDLSTRRFQTPELAKVRSCNVKGIRKTTLSFATIMPSILK